jgi:hypothetical protein
MPPEQPISSSEKRAEPRLSAMREVNADSI